MIPAPFLFALQCSTREAKCTEKLRFGGVRRRTL